MRILILALLAGTFLLQGPVSAAEAKSFDVVVFGATPSGVFAAVAASREGASVALVEPAAIVGGIMSSGLSFSDSNQMARECLLGIFEEFHLRVEKHYTDRGIELPYSVKVKDQKPWTYEPHVAEATFQQLLSESHVALFLNQDLKELKKTNGRIEEIHTTSGEVLKGRVFIDASYEGDLLAKAGVSYRVGREPKSTYNESLAGHQFSKQPVPVNPFLEGEKGSERKLLPLMTGTSPGDDSVADGKIMVYSFRMCLNTDPEKNVPITKPADYNPQQFELYRRYFKAIPKTPFPVDLYPIPGGKLDGNNGIGKQFSIGLVGENWDWPEADAERRKEIWQAHKSYTHGLLWFLANDESVPEPIQKQAKTLGLARDEFQSSGNWPPILYVREGRRMLGDFVLTQADILTNTTKEDVVGIGSFPIDSHDCQRIATDDGGFINEGTIFPNRLKSRKIGQPHHLPYRCLLPKATECTNLLVPVSLSASHVAFSSVRVEPAWMILGQASGTAAALIVKQDVDAQKLPYEALKTRLLKNGQVLELPDLP